eukprot:GGOE01061322.1.p1 GENE.GGOE01061322.1~~GGOE01061322.1.p1  ORF type:complete len:292 (+),score=71.74 GGOE01061322.1:76-951(+)
MATPTRASLRMPKRDRGEEGDDSNDEEVEGDVAAAPSSLLDRIPLPGNAGDPYLYRQPPCITIADTQYTRYFALDVRKESHADQYILRHHNDICILGLAESHYLLLPGASPITQVSYSFGNRDRLKDVHHTGKRKRGSFLCNPDTLLCEIHTENGASCRVISGVNGWLYELNERLLTQPQLIRQAPYSDGFIAIVCPKDSKSIKALAKHTSDAEYTALLAAGRAQRATCALTTEPAPPPPTTTLTVAAAIAVAPESPPPATDAPTTGDCVAIAAEPGDGAGDAGDACPMPP